MWPTIVLGMTTSPKREETLNLARRRFIEYKATRNDVNMTSDLNLHECSRHIILDESLFHAVIRKVLITREGGCNLSRDK
jgi:hypothetical protein